MKLFNFSFSFAVHHWLRVRGGGCFALRLVFGSVPKRVGVFVDAKLDVAARTASGVRGGKGGKSWGGAQGRIPTVKVRMESWEKFRCRKTWGRGRVVVDVAVRNCLWLGRMWVRFFGGALSFGVWSIKKDRKDCVQISNICAVLTSGASSNGGRSGNEYKPMWHWPCAKVYPTQNTASPSWLQYLEWWHCHWSLEDWICQSRIGILLNQQDRIVCLLPESESSVDWASSPQCRFSTREPPAVNQSCPPSSFMIISSRVES